MRKVFIFPLLFLVVFLILLPQAWAETSTEKVIIVYHDDIDESLITDLDGQIDQTYHQVSTIIAELPNEEAKMLLQQNDKVLSVEVDQIIQINSQIQNWGIEKVHAAAAWELEYTGKGINIAIIDTGIAVHKDLTIAGGVSFLPDSTSYNDENGHGTHIAGIIAAQNNGNGISGVAPNANIFAVKALDENGQGLVSRIVAGVDWAITNNMDIINISLGTSQESLSLKNIVNKAYDKGVLVVAAAGNNGNQQGTGNTVQYPAIYPSVIAVSAIDSLERRPSFSATGSAIEVTAPGVNIYSTHLNNGYVNMSGTSMAAPFVSGVLALLIEANPTLSHIQIREKLQQSALDIGSVGRDPLFGFGIVQAPKILELKEGDRLPEVIQLKLDLERANFFISSNPTNWFGPVTTQKVREFQTVFGLNETGIADRTTLLTLKKVINGEITRPPVINQILKEGDNHPDVIRLKLDLEKVGFRVSVTPTSWYGPITTQKVREFQAVFGLKETGVADSTTLLTLKKVINGEITRSPIPEKVLKEGDRRPEVTQLKLDLEKVGFQVSATPTNWYGPITTQKVREFQKAFLLPVTGVTNSETLTTLRKAINGEILFLQEGDRRSEVIQLKLDLEKAGFSVSSNPTNWFGPITTEQVMKFQAKHKLPVDGLASPLLLGKLMEVNQNR
ncbi:hypothetical protein BKP45_06785 [Anaerobacillus alkalidiazotrophicus]|uniref:Peptidase S8/S53 domain-containing protein n=1 Tax=Anaerobacillus alkalidiazotrophicus TaxID=472963 RepID=A0A1S2MCE6_9BACI|nr:S8 family serine peptidase [Anaerobacillus alkalidiazotrophicus]OIJ22339.1 hypothetical protein BKP45_06785 [Anaerobacillus alkalidiazotrophicus]